MGVLSLGGICGCCGCSFIVCVTACGGAVGSGITIDIYSTGGVFLTSCNTIVGGCCTISTLSAGTYNIRVIYGGSTHNLGNHAVTCGGTLTVSVGSPPGTDICCGTCSIPATLTLTDSAAGCTLGYAGLYQGTYQSWAGCELVTKSCYSVDTGAGGGSCTPVGPSNQSMLICYLMYCTGGSPSLTCIRSWGYIFIPVLTPVWYSGAAGHPPGTATCTPAGTFCSPAPPAACGTPLTDTDSGTANPTSCGDSGFAVSFSMTPAGGNSTSDPITGNVSVSG